MHFEDGPQPKKMNQITKCQSISKCLFGVFNSPKKRTKTIQLEVKQNSYKGDRLRDSWLTGITRQL